ncbi:hypothetical protein E2C01_015403 [Portunus trituberculatus]|uniref:Uncharacterized protein n=1 Tax=Portunus trituberculatus TaxID=210409 RepID=A0A5B7DMS7_PORTR|nr:hypothetical protein [Portunus trituberculatus]
MNNVTRQNSTSFMECSRKVEQPCTQRCIHYEEYCLVPTGDSASVKRATPSSSTSDSGLAGTTTLTGLGELVEAQNFLGHSTIEQPASLIKEVLYDLPIR